VITCSSYANRHTVYSAATFCPVCGLRPTTDIVLELIQPHGTCWQRKTGSKRTSARALRAGGVFERLAVDVLKSVVSVFESFARQQFRERVANAEELTSDSGNVFQRLDHTAALFSEHAGVDLIAIAGQGRWQDLRSRSRPARLTHGNGIVDERFLTQVPNSPLKDSQRLVIRRADAEAALGDLAALVRGLAAS